MTGGMVDCFFLWNGEVAFHVVLYVQRGGASHLPTPVFLQPHIVDESREAVRGYACHEGVVEFRS